jgi:hypothetical protein
MIIKGGLLRGSWRRAEPGGGIGPGAEGKVGMSEGLGGKKAQEKQIPVPRMLWWCRMYRVVPRVVCCRVETLFRQSCPIDGREPGKPWVRACLRLICSRPRLQAPGPYLDRNVSTELSGPVSPQRARSRFAPSNPDSSFPNWGPLTELPMGGLDAQVQRPNAHVRLHLEP